LFIIVHLIVAYAETPMCEILMFRFLNFSGMRYKSGDT